MIDIHAHILAEIDDGSKSWEESLAMATRAFTHGVRHIIATPHVKLYDAHDLTMFSRIEQKCNHLRTLLAEKKIDITIHQGAELEPDFDALELVKEGVALIRPEGERTSWNDSVDPFEINGGELPGRSWNDRMVTDDAVKPENGPDRLLRHGAYVLFHFPLTVIPPYLQHLVFGVASSGVTPILAHPERNAEMGRHVDLIRNLISSGALIQMNADSVLGTHSRTTRRHAELLLKNKLVHFIATDCHSVKAGSLDRGIERAKAFDRDIDKKVQKNAMNVILGKAPEARKLEQGVYC